MHIAAVLYFAWDSKDFDMNFDHADAGHMDFFVAKKKGTVARVCRAGGLPDDIWEMLK